MLLTLSLPPICAQATYILLAGRANYNQFSYLAFFNPDFTFNLCLTKDLAALGRLGLQYVTPFYILLLLLLLLLLTKVKVRWISQRLGRHSFMKSFWFLILISYLNIALTTFELLHCRTIGPSNGERQVLDHDASITCYKNGHLPAAIFAILTAIFIVLPFPLFTGILIYLPRFKPFTDAYTFMYRDWRRLWVAWSLFRRLLLVLLGVFVTGFAVRHFSLLLGLLWILIVDIVTWPYRYYIDNLFSIFISWLLVVIAVLTQPQLYLYIDPSRGPSGALVLLGILAGVILVVVERVLWRRGDTVDGAVGRMVRRWRKWVKERLGGKGVPASEDMRDLPRYRESLLEQFPLEQQEDAPRKKWRLWQKKKQRAVDVAIGHTPSGATSSSVMVTSVAMEDLDSGLATMRSEYSNHSNDSSKT